MLRRNTVRTTSSYADAHVTTFAGPKGIYTRRSTCCGATLVLGPRRRWLCSICCKEQRAKA